MQGWEQRPPSEIQIGNGTLLATLDAMGELEQIFTPYIDAHGSRLGAFRTSILVPAGSGGSRVPERIRITSEHFDVRLQLETGSQVLRAEYHHRYRGLRVERLLGLHPTEPILLDRWRVVEGGPAGLVHESVPWMGSATSAHCSLYHPNFGGLVHHRGRRWLGVIPLTGDPHWVRVGHLNEHDRYRMWGGERIFAPVGPEDMTGFPAGPVRVGWDQVVQGPATWGSLALAPSDRSDGVLEIAVLCADGERQLGRMLEGLRHVGSERFYQMIESQVERRHGPAQETLRRIKNPRVRALCERSVDVLHALQDGHTGALMAAAEVDPHAKVSGGYGYSWPRDGAYLAAALGAFGYRDRVEHYFKFLHDTQDETGAWWQRYLATGHAGPSWGRIQIDEPASAIWLAYLHYRRTGDLFWLEKYWPMIQRGLKFLEDFHGGAYPMGQPSHDLWEERMGIHAYSLGAVRTAFLSGAYFARELSDRKLQRHYHQQSHRFRKMIYEQFVSHGKIRRSLVVNSFDYVTSGGHWDELTDVSMLGLVMPFGVLGAKDPETDRLIADMRSKLWTPKVGGLLRYEWDTYRGGNPWLITTMWLACVELLRGNFGEARECFQWTMAKATPLGMMPEQVHREQGNPYWVIPLGWSHAMFLWFVRMALDRGVDSKIWDEI